MMYVSVSDPSVLVDAIQVDKPMALTGHGPFTTDPTVIGPGDWLVNGHDGQRFVFSHVFEVSYRPFADSPMPEITVVAPAPTSEEHHE